MPTYQEILETAYQRATDGIAEPLIKGDEIRERVDLVSRNLTNRALVRLVLTCSLAKAHNPQIDARKPYTEIGDDDAFAGRPIDERYIGPFAIKHKLPCNATTAFLTPALRNITAPLSSDLSFAGRPRELYTAVFQLLEDLQSGKVSAEDLLAETLRALLVFKNEQQQRMETLLAGIKTTDGALPLSSEMIVGLVTSHLNAKGASRLPVLIVAAAYHAAGALIGEQVRPLESHNAADKQTGSIGDVEVVLTTDDRIVTGYEMKLKRVTTNDIDIALPKIFDKGIDNYIFITTEVVTDEVKEYAASLYEKTGGVEIVVLDCISFLRHFLHFFHRFRAQYLNAYQELVLSQPDSSVSATLKELWLTLRQNAESGDA
jgi:DNA adenine methylase